MYQGLNTNKTRRPHFSIRFPSPPKYAHSYALSPKAPTSNKADTSQDGKKSTHSVNITAARFKIGHTPRKLPDIPSATSRFNAYLLQSCKNYFNIKKHRFQGLLKPFSIGVRKTLLNIRQRFYERCTKTLVFAPYFVKSRHYFARLLHSYEFLFLTLEIIAG